MEGEGEDRGGPARSLAVTAKTRSRREKDRPVDIKADIFAMPGQAVGLQEEGGRGRPRTARHEEDPPRAFASGRGVQGAAAGGAHAPGRRGAPAAGKVEAGGRRAPDPHLAETSVRAAPREGCPAHRVFHGSTRRGGPRRLQRRSGRSSTRSATSWTSTPGSGRWW